MQYRPEIDGLRAVAVLPVILFHAGFNIFQGGFVGVDVFFVISGYLITSILLEEHRQNKFSIINFYERRARRILPALFVVLAATLAVAWFWLLPNDFKSLSQSVVATILYGSNILFWKTAGYFDTSAEFKPLLHTWSLAVEEQFYVVFPLILAALWRFGSRVVVPVMAGLAIVSLLVAQINVREHPDATFYLLHSRGWELLIGALCALEMARQLPTLQSPRLSFWGSLLGAGALIFSIFVFDKEVPFPSVFTLVPTLGAALIILFASANNLIGQLLQSKIMVRIGLLSYSAYLWHQPLLALARHHSLHEPPLWLMGSLCLFTFVLAHLTWKYVETPFRDRKRIGRDRIFFGAAAFSLTFLILGLIGHLQKGFPARFDRLTAELQADNVNFFWQQLEPCLNKFRSNPALAGACTFGNKDIKPTFAVLGDSHAGALVHQFNAIAESRGVSGINITFKGCPPLKDLAIVHPQQDDLVCAKLREDVFKKLAQPDALPETVVVHARWTLLMERDRFDNGEGVIEGGDRWVWSLPDDAVAYKQGMAKVFQKSIQAILDSGRKVILIYPIPEMGWQVPTQLAKSNLLDGPLRVDSASTSFAQFKVRNKAAIDALDALGEQARLVRVKPHTLLCDKVVPGRCVAHLDKQPLYFDDDHLSNVGSELVVREVFKHL